MKKKVLIWVLAAVLVLSMAGCAAGAVSSNDKYVGMEPTAAAEAAAAETEGTEAAAAETKDTTSISDLIRVPFGYLLDWLYTFTNNYGLALILFSLIVKLVLLPMSVKSKKSMLKMSRLSPQVKALEAKYGDDKQKYQLAVQQMYKEEGVSMGGGCLWSFIPLLILLPLYYVIREPITYMMHNSRSISEAIVAFLQASGENLGKNAYYAQLAAAGHIGDYMEELKSLAVTANANLQAMNFQFLGIDLAAIPTFRFWDCEGWSEIGLFLIPVVSAGLQAVSMWISQKMNNQVATNADGEQDVDAAKTANQTNATMMLMMPLMSLWIGFSMPAAISIYWIAQAVFGAVQDYFLTKHYRKVYDEEDAVKQEIAAKRRAEEAEKERQRALRREQNPDGITDNVSKKKIRQQEKEAAEKAAKAYEARKNPVQESEEKKPLSGDPERPYSRGRAYDPAHYGRKRPAGSDAEQTEE
ncbi:inner membrane protein OxaA [Firmicutes bacterium CAG:124]|nr:inner membrane protein OxaA [Firmicutes bacterium CAG:124]